jgi:iron complex transport system permease protein
MPRQAQQMLAPAPADSYTEIAGQLRIHARQVRRRAILVALLALATAAAFLFDIATGPAGMPLADLLRALAGADVPAPMRVIVWDVRLPQALMALAVGAALSLAGAEMQTILDNPLASPFTLGVSSAASLGAALALVLGIGLPGTGGSWAVSANAFIFALASVLLLQALSRLRGSGPETLVLVGIALVFTFNALVALVQFVASQEALQQLVFWGMGSLTRGNWEKLGILALVLAAVAPFSMLAAWKLTALRLGVERARSFGIDVSRLRFVSLVRVSLLAATSVAFVGTIGFIGLVGPHIARLLVGEDHRFFLPASMLTGALVLSLSSIASKLLLPGAVLPVGIVTSLVGVPFFIVLVFARRERS